MYLIWTFPERVCMVDVWFDLNKFNLYTLQTLCPLRDNKKAFFLKNDS